MADTPVNASMSPALFHPIQFVCRNEAAFGGIHQFLAVLAFAAIRHQLSLFEQNRIKKGGPFLFAFAGMHIVDPVVGGPMHRLVGICVHCFALFSILFVLYCMLSAFMFCILLHF